VVNACTRRAPLRHQSKARRIVIRLRTTPRAASDLRKCARRLVKQSVTVEAGTRWQPQYSLRSPTGPGPGRRRRCRDVHPAARAHHQRAPAGAVVCSCRCPGGRALGIAGGDGAAGPRGCVRPRVVRSHWRRCAGAQSDAAVRPRDPHRAGRCARPGAHRHRARRRPARPVGPGVRRGGG